LNLSSEKLLSKFAFKFNLYQYAAVHVVRCFDDDDVIHVEGKVDPLDDISVINFELALADMAQIEKRLATLSKFSRTQSNDAKAAEQEERDVLAKIAAFLDLGKPARLCELSEVGLCTLE
jgi:ribosome-binding ATPase YchF (GTP1/OBG family)